MKKKKNCGKRPSLVHQAKLLFESMFCPGRSKHKDKRHNGGKPLRSVIYSASTLKTYLARCIAFLSWAKAEYGIKWIEEGRKYVAEYLEARINRGLSPHTIFTDASAIAKMYGCSYLDFGGEMPRKSRVGTSRYDNITESDIADFSDADPDIFAVAFGAGPRVHEMYLTLPAHYRFVFDKRGVVIDGSVWIKGKGGRTRRAQLLPEYAPAIYEIVSRATAAGQRKVFPYIPDGLPIHYMRHMYAAALYAQHARPVRELERKDRYYCRQDMRGIVLDRDAMQIVSNALGHNRLGVTTVYLRTAIYHPASIVTLPPELIQITD